MLSSFIITIVYWSVAIIAFYFLLANFSLMGHTGGGAVVPSNYSVDTDQYEPQPAYNKMDKRRLEIQKELESYGKKLMDHTKKESMGIVDKITQKFKYKQKPADKPDAKDTILNHNLKNVSPVTEATQKAPDLENYEDYAPVDTPINHGKPILATNKTVPNYLDVAKDAYYGKSGPLALNEFDTYQPANFTSERRNAWHDKVPSNDLSFFFQKNPFKSFDDISRADIVDPAEWDRVVKKKEGASPMLSMDSMKQDKEGFMPSNHYDMGKKFSNLC